MVLEASNAYIFLGDGSTLFLMVSISIVRVCAVMVIAVETLAHYDLVIEGPELY